MNNGSITYNANGLLVETASAKAQNVINLELSVPGHRNGAEYHKTSGLDAAIDGLSTAEAIYVIHRIE